MITGINIVRLPWLHHESLQSIIDLACSAAKTDDVRESLIINLSAIVSQSERWLQDMLDTPSKEVIEAIRVVGLQPAIDQSNREASEIADLLESCKQVRKKSQMAVARSYMNMLCLNQTMNRCENEAIRAQQLQPAQA